MLVVGRRRFDVKVEWPSLPDPRRRFIAFSSLTFKDRPPGSLYYKLLPLFTHFIQSDKYRLDVLRLLQGEVFDRDEIEVLDAMRSYIQTVENSDKHFFKRHLTTTPIDD